MILSFHIFDSHERARPGSSSGARQAARYSTGAGYKAPSKKTNSRGFSLTVCLFLLFASCSPHFSLLPEPVIPPRPPVLAIPAESLAIPPPPLPLPETDRIFSPPVTSVPARDIELVRLCEQMKLLENDTRHRIAEERNTDIVGIYQRALDTKIAPVLERCRREGVIR